MAVACAKELEEGVDGMENMFQNKGDMPAIVVIPLLSDGCVDTEVDEQQVLRAINLSARHKRRAKAT